LKADTDRAGRVRIQPDLTVPAHPDIFVIGDTATLNQDGKPLGGVAQVAMQQGRYAGRLIERRVSGKTRTASISLLRQGHHGRRRSRLCRLANGQVEHEGIDRVAGVGGRAHHVPGATRSPAERLPAVDVDVPDTAARLTAHRGSSRVRPGDRGDGDYPSGAACQ